MLGVLVLAIVGAFGWFIVVPQFEELETLSSKKETLETELIQKRQIANNLDKFKAEFDKMEEQLTAALKQLPNKAELPTLLTNLSSLAKDNGLEVLNFKPMSEVKKGFYAEVPTALKLTGTFHQIAMFTQSVGELSRIVNVSNLALTAPKVTGGQAMLKIGCKVTTFRFVDK
jgi:type IV pilus assembly protein PilO